MSRKRTKNNKNLHHLKAKGCPTFLVTIYGFFLGSLITLWLYYFFTVELKLPIPIHIFTVLSCICPVAFAFSRFLRCTVLLFVIQFSSKKGRVAVLTLAFGLALSGPGINFIQNLDEANRCLLCAQNRMNQALEDAAKIFKQPYTALKEVLKNMTEKMKDSLRQIKFALTNIYTTILRICIL